MVTTTIAPEPWTPRVGHVVRLHSGGPAMTIRRIKKDVGGKTIVYATWFNRALEQQDGQFDIEQVAPSYPDVYQQWGTPADPSQMWPYLAAPLVANPLVPNPLVPPYPGGVIVKSPPSVPIGDPPDGTIKIR